MSADIDVLRKKALYIKQFYIQKQQEKGRELWTASDYMAGFVADVGELSELIMAKKGIRNVDDVDKKLAHELSDCLYSIFIIADELNIDLADNFVKDMNALAKRIEEKGK
jgi:NTP pyrophosphatase (non-canonical NTP hydrolase)